MVTWRRSRSLEIVWLSLKLEQSIRVKAFVAPIRSFANTSTKKVFPTPDGPGKKSIPAGLFGSIIPCWYDANFAVFFL